MKGLKEHSKKQGLLVPDYHPVPKTYGANFDTAKRACMGRSLVVKFWVKHIPNYFPTKPYEKLCHAGQRIHYGVKFVAETVEIAIVGGSADGTAYNRNEIGTLDILHAVTEDDREPSFLHPSVVRSDSSFGQEVGDTEKVLRIHIFFFEKFSPCPIRSCLLVVCE